MGGSCTPQKHETTQIENDLNIPDKQERVESNVSETITKVINNYEADNKKLKRELKELKSRNQEETTNHEEKARQNEEVMKELAAMKKILEEKDRALVRGQLEAALRSTATTMCSIESKTRICMEGNLKHHHRSGLGKSKKVKHVDLRLTEGELLANEYKAGYLTLTYADSKEAQTAKRCKVLDVALDESKSNESILKLNVSAEGALTQLVFVCESADNKEEWVKCITNALNEIHTAWNEMNEEFTLKLEFTKEKIGIRVEEVFIDQNKYDEEAKEASDKIEGTMLAAAREFEMEQKKASDNPEDVVKKLKQADMKAIAKDEQEEPQKPCMLTVRNILDEDLIKAGLFENCIFSKINDIALVGKVYSEQTDLLKSTPKPYTITFTGKNFMKKKGAPQHAYFSILKELVADGENAVKKAFHELVKGSPFETELQSSNNQAATIEALLSDQRRLMALLRNMSVQEMEL